MKAVHSHFPQSQSNRSSFTCIFFLYTCKFFFLKGNFSKVFIRMHTYFASVMIKSTGLISMHFLSKTVKLPNNYLQTGLQRTANHTKAPRLSEKCYQIQPPLCVMPRVRVPKTERIRRPQQCKSIKGFITSSSQSPGFIQHSGIRQRPQL